MKTIKIAVDKSGTGFRPPEKLQSAFIQRQAAEKPAAASADEKPVCIERIAAAAGTDVKSKVAAYCRVSTLLDSQETSIEGQRNHYEMLIRGNSDWEYAGIYLEAGVSGTRAEVRPELQRLIADCKAGKIDLILTKSISRFARNTQDCIEMVRLLTALGVTIRFEKENIDTGDMASEFMLSVLACLAENESHSISGNLKWGIRRRFANGTYKQPVPPYGYVWAEGKLTIQPEQARIVKEIFSMTLSGTGSNSIADKLNAKEVMPPRGGKWLQGTIRQIIRNPAYTGDALYQKTYMDENFAQKRNKGELDWYLDADHHEAIISKADFENAQLAIGQRAKGVGYDGTEQKRGSNRYCFSGILTCKVCGSVMQRQQRGNGVVCWKCRRHSMSAELCPMKPQDDADLKRAFINCLNKLAWAQSCKDPDIRILDVYETMLGKSEALKHAERLEEIDAALAEVYRETAKLNAIIMREGFLPEHREKKLTLTKREQELNHEKNRLLISGIPAGTILKLKAFVGSWQITDDPEAFPEGIFNEFVGECSVFSGNMVTFHFRCGLKLSESLYQINLEDEI